MTAKTRYEFEPDYAVAPGETLAETLDSLEMTQVELAKRTGLTEQSINRIIKGSQPLTFETASKLELATGVPSRFWNNLEAQYRELLVSIKNRAEFQRGSDWLNTIPLEELIDRGVVQRQSHTADQVRAVLEFYRVASVKAWHESWEKGDVAARCSQSVKTEPGPTSAWLRLGEICADRIDCKAYDRGIFNKAIISVRALTVETPEVFVPKMVELCANAGVALCLVPEIPKAPWYGASKWLTSQKAMILLSLRGKRDDQFWFSFFHESGHILLHSKKDLYLSDNSSEDPREQEANKFASEFLIPSDARAKIPTLRSRAQVCQLASQLGIAPGIVVGQYQHMTENYWFNDLKRKFVWAE